MNDQNSPVSEQKIPTGVADMPATPWEFKTPDGTQVLEFKTQAEVKAAVLARQVTTAMLCRRNGIGDFSPTREVLFEAFMLSKPIRSRMKAGAQIGSGSLGCLGAIISAVVSIIAGISTGLRGQSVMSAFIITVPVTLGALIGGGLLGGAIGGLIGMIIGVVKYPEIRKMASIIDGK